MNINMSLFENLLILCDMHNDYPPNNCLDEQ